MRLIDADKMKLEVNSANPLIKEYAKEIENWRDTQPTVKAIPIEWIKNWFNPKYANTVYYSLLRDLIKDWEKENEK